MAAADFFLRGTQVPAHPWLGLLDSASVPAFYTAGNVQYWVYEPSTAAEATIGVLPGSPKPVLICWPTLSSGLTGVGVNEGLNMTDGAFAIPQKLGFGANRDGTAKLTPGGGNQTWPFLTVFPQFATNWLPAISGASTRCSWMINDAILRDIFAAYNIDKTRIYGTGISGNGARLTEYVMAQYKNPRQLRTRFAAVIPCAGALSGSGWRQDFPDAIQNESTANQTLLKISRYITREMDIGYWEFHSVNDEQSTPLLYNPMMDPARFWLNLQGAGNPITVGGGASAGTVYRAKNFRYTEYTGGSAPLHASVWDLAYGNNTVSGALVHTNELWAWMAQQRALPMSRFLAVDTQLLDFSGPLPAGGGVLQPALPGDSGMMMRMMRRRRRPR